MAHTLVNRRNGSKIDVNNIKQYTATHKSNENIEYSISLAQVILGTKFANRDFENVLNLARAYSETTDVKDIEKTLVRSSKIQSSKLYLCIKTVLL